MISRIRLDAYGRTADEVERTLYPHATEIEKLLGVSVGRGECVIERQMEEAEDSSFAFRGRLILHPDISPGLAAVDLTENPTVLFAGTGDILPYPQNT